MQQSHLDNENLREWFALHSDHLIGLYRHLHANPELSMQESRTASCVARELASAGVEVTPMVGGFGVVGVLRNGPGPTIMIRAGLDALPIRETTDLGYASHRNAVDSCGHDVPVMHASGHDLHLTNLIGVARYLDAHRGVFSGTILFVAQPAEELATGARAMLSDNLFARFPTPDAVLALHVDAELPAGMVACRAGATLAGVDTVEITLRGAGGPGAHPHATLARQAIDPIIQAAQLVLDLQTIPSREVSALEPAVLTVGSIRGGSCADVIGEDCTLAITVRSLSEEVRAQILGSISRKATAIAMSHGAPKPRIDAQPGTDVLVNDSDLANAVIPALRGQLGERNVRVAGASMGGDDLSLYGAAGVPVFVFWLGSVSAERQRGMEDNGTPPPSLYSSDYYPDAAESLATGIPAMVTAVLRSLEAVNLDRDRTRMIPRSRLRTIAAG